MNNFIYHTPTKVYFGKDEELKVGEIIKEYGGTKVLIHYGGESAVKSGLLDRVKEYLSNAGLPLSLPKESRPGKHIYSSMCLPVL